MVQNITSKITIIGAGPAGATLALFLAKYKIPHLLIDQASFPRDKICGDGLTCEVPRILRELDESIYQEFINADWVKPSNGAYIELKNGQKTSFESDNFSRNTSAVFVAKREIFDNWLISKLNTEYTQKIFSFKAESITRIGDLVEITGNQNGEKITIISNLIIGADGERSIVRKTFHPEGIKKNREHCAAAIRCYYKGIEKLSDGNPLEMYQPKLIPKGYLWIFHLPNGEANVGFGGLSSDISENKINLVKEMNLYIQSNPDLKNRFKNAEALETPKGWGLPQNSDAYNYVGDNYLLIGDSAKFIEPLTGKGIGVAMFAAMLAVPTIKNAISKNTFNKNQLISFENVIENKYRAEWDKLYKLQNKVINAWYVPLFVTLLNITFIKNYLIKKQKTKTRKFLNKPLNKKVLDDYNLFENQ